MDVLLLAAIAAGFFGGSHCLAMCGSIVLLFEGQQNTRGKGLIRRLFYNTGRMLFYVTVGVIAGTSGGLLVSHFGPGLLLLRLVAAVLIVLFGLTLVFDWQVLRSLEKAGALIWKRLAPLTRYVLPVRSVPTAMAAGFLWGALPCGLVYSVAALAATSGNGLYGGLVMFAFWLGTLPALLFAGLSAGRIHEWRSRTAFRRSAGAVMILAGLASLSMPLLHANKSDHDAHQPSALLINEVRNVG